MRITSKMLASDFDVAFVSMEKDLETVVRKLFVESKPYSDYLKRLLVINEKNCLDDSQHQYRTLVDGYSVMDLKEKGYIRFTPRLDLNEHEEAKSYIYVAFEDVAPSLNPQFNNITLSIMCICSMDDWELDDYALRPWKMAGYIHGLLNNARMSGIGELQFVGATQFSFDEVLGGVKLSYLGTHGMDDVEKASEMGDG